jgi:hypothetical protein
MATHLTAGGASSFITNNMKPNAGEQADALWAQNAVENSGHNHWRHQPLPIVRWSGSGSDGSLISALFYKRASHNAIRAAFASNANMGSITATLTAFGATSDYGNYGAADASAATVSSAISLGADSLATLELNISGLSDGGLYYARLSFSSPVASPHPPGLFLIHSLAATY